MSFRDLAADDRALLQRLVSVDFPGSAEVIKQLETAKVRQVDEDGSLEFQLKTTVLAPVRQRVPVEAEAPDADGILLHALLHVDKGRVVELEIYKDDGSPILRKPKPEEWDVFALPPMPE